jgi:ferric-dicitrate binding protein FerR (iron transport regulator)
MSTMQELTELCGCVRDGNATPEQVARLEQYLSESAEARRYYMRFMQIGALLERYEQAPAGPAAPPRVATTTLFPRKRVLFVLALAAGVVIALLVPSVRKPGSP